MAEDGFITAAAAADSSTDCHRYARAPHLWALGVGTVISGDFFGWQSALVAGFDGLLLVLVIVTALYVLLAFSIAELSTMFPSGGGPYVFALHGIGDSAAFFAGIAESLKVIVTCSVVVTGIGSYLNRLTGLSEAFAPVWWALFYVSFVALNVHGVALSFRIQVAATLLSIVLLLVFYVAAIPHLSYDQWVVQQHWRSPSGWDGVFKGVSFAMWFYLGIEELPLAVEETIKPEKNMPIGLVSSIATLVVIAFSTVICNAMISPGARAISMSDSPLLEGYKSVFGDNSTTACVTWLLVVGLISSLHSFIFCMGQLLHAIARNGFLPRALTRCHPQRDTPYVALIAGSGLGFAVMILLHTTIGDAALGSVLINLSLIGALVSYAFQLIAFIQLRKHDPRRARPYKSPFGVSGAVVSLGLCALALLSIVYNGVSSPDFLASLGCGVAFFGCGGAYFLLRVRPSLACGESTRPFLHKM